VPRAAGSGTNRLLSALDVSTVPGGDPSPKQPHGQPFGNAALLQLQEASAPDSQPTSVAQDLMRLVVTLGCWRFQPVPSSWRCACSTAARRASAGG